MSLASRFDPLDVWFKFENEDDEDPILEANTYKISEDHYVIEWDHVDVGQISEEEFDSLEEAHAWYEQNGFQDFSY